MKRLARFTIYNLLGTFDAILKRDSKIVVYCYHNITHNAGLYHVTPGAFRRQMEYLSKHGNFVTLSDIALYLQNKKQLPPKSFAITFDDGYKGVKHTLPITKDLGISPAVFILPRREMVDRGEIATQSELLNGSDLRELVTAGWEIGLHGLTHKKLTKLPLNQIKKEVLRPSGISYFAYPHGKYNAIVLGEIQNQGYELGLTMDDEQITSKTNKLAIPRVGVMGNHSDLEFRYLASPSVLAFRKAVKNTFLRKYI